MANTLLWIITSSESQFEPRCEKTGLRGCLGCTVTEDGKRLEISDLGSRGIALSV